MLEHVSQFVTALRDSSLVGRPRCPPSRTVRVTVVSRFRRPSMAGDDEGVLVAGERALFEATPSAHLGGGRACMADESKLAVKLQKLEEQLASAKQSSRDNLRKLMSAEKERKEAAKARDEEVKAHDETKAAHEAQSQELANAAVQVDNLAQALADTSEGALSEQLSQTALPHCPSTLSLQTVIQRTAPPHCPSTLPSCTLPLHPATLRTAPPKCHPAHCPSKLPSCAPPVQVRSLRSWPTSVSTCTPSRISTPRRSRSSGRSSHGGRTERI